MQTTVEEIRFCLSDLDYQIRDSYLDVGIAASQSLEVRKNPRSRKYMGIKLTRSLISTDAHEVPTLSILIIGWAGLSDTSMELVRFVKTAPSIRYIGWAITQKTRVRGYRIHWIPRDIFLCAEEIFVANAHRCDASVDDLLKQNINSTKSINTMWEYRQGTAKGRNASRHV
jgi:hypothetical protein